MKNAKIIYILLGLAVTIFIVRFFFLLSKENKELQVIKVYSFAECAKAGLPVMESYPRQCRAPNGVIYLEKILAQAPITYVNASVDMITVDESMVGAKQVVHKFTIVGEARGPWFFEASFPIEVLDKNGKQIATSHGQAIGEWMTEEFVAFTGDVIIPESYSGPATVVLHKDNPSGLPEHDASISFPITIIVENPIVGKMLESGVAGTVLLGPTCPVMRNPPDPQCADKPYQTDLALTTEDGSRIVKTFSSDPQGKFTVPVSPGRYVISSSAKASMYPRCSSGDIEVKAGQYTKADVSCDTGIR